jgi:hypothetical protein
MRPNVCTSCGRPSGKAAPIYYTPGGGAVYLCGRKSCGDLYEAHGQPQRTCGRPPCPGQE